jgi:hypothetical protein
MNNDFEQPDPLDELLAQARWPDVPAESSARQRAQWSAISPSRRSRWKAWALSSAAAVVVVAAIVWTNRSPTNSAVVVNIETQPSAAVTLSYPSRPVTRRDELLIRMAELRTSEHRVSRNDAAAHARQAAELLERVRAEMPGAVETVLDPQTPPAVRQGVINALFAQMEDSNVENRLIAARALADIDGPQTIARLGRMIDQNVSRREALAALVWSSRHSTDAARLLEQARRSPRLASSIRAIELTL